MTNRFDIFYDCRIDIPMVFLKFDGYEGFHVPNHSVVDVDIEPGKHKLFAGYQLIVGDASNDYVKEMDVTIEPNRNYTVKICPYTKTMTFVKRMDGLQRCC